MEKISANTSHVFINPTGDRERGLSRLSRFPQDLGKRCFSLDRKSEVRRLAQLIVHA
jgi:hypothetical protein